MTQNIIMMVSLAVLGVGLWVFAAYVWHRSSHVDRKPVVDYTSDKLGTIRVNAFALIALCGSAAIAAAIVFWYKGYEDRLSTLQEKVAGLEASIAVFKEYELVFSLIFSNTNSPDIKTMVWPPTAYVQREGEREPKPYDLANFQRGPGGVIAS